MTGYLARRLGMSAITMVILTAAVYASIRWLPGGPSTADAQGSTSVRETWLARYHPLDPLPVGYARWLGDVARLDLGLSLSVQPGAPVADILAAALPYTLLLGALAFALTVCVALPLGLLSAWKPRSAGARSTAVLLYALHALPGFWIALALQQVVSGRWGWLPPLGAGPLDAVPGPGGVAASAPYWILPTLAVTLGPLAFVIRFCRTALLEAIAQGYAVGARARGAGMARVLCAHALAGSAVPFISLLGLILPAALSGGIVVETIFGLPGMGRLFFLAASRRDYPVLMALSCLFAAATMATQLLADLLYRRADPRVAWPADRGETEF